LNASLYLIATRIDTGLSVAKCQSTAGRDTPEQRIASIDQEKIDLPGNELIAEHGLRLNVLIPIYPAGKPLVGPKTHIRRKGMIR
jgi:hypothetical protein